MIVSGAGMQEKRSAFISTMRRVASSVTVVTTNGPFGRHGATVSAFCSVSADPPTVLVCLHSKSRIADLVARNRCYNVNVLPDDCEHLARRFCGVEDELFPDRFSEISLVDEEIPAISGATIVRCSLQQSIVSGSHQIMIGRVLSTTESAIKPLAFLDGSYHEVRPLAGKPQEWC